MNLIRNLLSIGIIQSLMNDDDRWKLANEAEYKSGGIKLRSKTENVLGFRYISLFQREGELYSLHLRDINETLLNPSKLDYGTPMLKGDPWYYAYYHESFGQNYLKLRVRFNGHAIALLKMPFQKEIYKDIMLSDKSDVFVNVISDENYFDRSPLGINEKGG